LLRLDAPSESFTATASLDLGADISLEFDLSGAIDVAAERARLAKDRAAAVKDLEANERKLGNEAFVAKAAPAAVEKARARLAAAQAELARIDAALATLPQA
jgi:valyl-tRNA synthetase